MSLFVDQMLTEQALASETFEVERAGDFHYVFRELVAGHLVALEHLNTSVAQVRLAQRIFLMQQGTDPRDSAGGFANLFEHLAGRTQRRLTGYGSWTGPASTASLIRILKEHVDWHAQGAASPQDHLDQLASATIEGTSGITVDDVLKWAFRHNMKDAFGKSSRWGVDGLSMTARPRREVSLNAVAPAAYSVPDTTGSDALHGIETDRFAGIYARSRVEADVMVFGGPHGRPNAQLIPRLPGLLLAAAYTVEYLTSDHLPDDLLPRELVDTSRSNPWNRVAIPALRLVDPELSADAAEKFCERAGQRLSWLTAVLSSTTPIDNDGN